MLANAAAAKRRNIGKPVGVLPPINDFFKWFLLCFNE